MFDAYRFALRQTISYMHLKIFVLLAFCFGSISAWHTANLVTSPPSETVITVENLSKKWKLEKYSYLSFSEAPEQQEQNDYISLKSDMSFESISEGLKDAGKWRLNAKEKRIYLFKQGETNELTFIINGLSETVLVLSLDAPDDKDAKNLKIHFKSI